MTATYQSYTDLIVNNDPILIHQSAGANIGTWELNVSKSTFPSSGSASVNLKYPLTFSPSAGCQVVRLRQWNNFTINSGKVSYLGSIWDNINYWGGILAFMDKGTTTINGNFYVAGGQGVAGTSGYPIGGVGYGYGGGVGDVYDNDGYSQPGGGWGPGGGGASNGHPNAGGGGGGYGTVGGVGYHNGAGVDGAGGITNGGSDLTNMNLGSGGGGSGGNIGESVGGGGCGGGILLLISKNIDFSGASSGSDLTGGGGNGSKWGSGGGSGGAVLIKCQNANLGTNKVIATGGAGGAGSSHVGAVGGVGRIHVDYKNSLTGTTNPTLTSTQDSSLIYPSAGMWFNL